MTVLLGAILTFLISYGYLTVAIVIFLSGFGLPLPASALIMAAGSFAVDGTLSFWAIVAIVSIAATLGDTSGYLLARYWRHVFTRFEVRFGITKAQLAKVDTNFNRWGVWYIFFTRWLVTPLGPVVNFTAGMRSYPLLQFIVYDFLGELVWTLLFSYLGYIFGASWPTLVSFVSGAPDVLSLVVIGAFAAAIARRMWSKRRRGVL